MGINAWVLHRNKDVFGADAGTFHPERWLGSKEDVAQLERYLFAVSAHFLASEPLHPFELTRHLYISSAPAIVYALARTSACSR